MNFAAVLAQLNDLPATFKRPAAPYTQIVDSLASGLNLFTSSVDTTVQQLTFATAVNGWLDVWGLIFGVLRQPNESDVPYKIRLSETLLAWVATVPGLQVWLNLFAPGGTIVENSSGLGYVLNFPASMTTAQITAFLITLNRVRPAGVPFTVNAVSAGLYLGTINFYGTGQLTGAYLASAVEPFSLTFSPGTNNAVPALPDLYLTDPTLNPSLASTF